MNPVRLRERAAITRALREWFDHNGYLEVHTPTLVKSPALEENLEAVSAGGAYLHTSPEFAMKRVLSSGLCRIYQIVPSYREEECGIHHSREFTMLEWYRVHAGTAELMEDVESLLRAAADAVGRELPLFSRRSVQSLREAANLSDTDDEVEWFRGWVDGVEPILTAPTIVHSYPAWQAALSRERRGVADRFEVYIDGVELGNCFAEEGDPNTLRHRFSLSSAKRLQMGREPHPVDEDLLASTPQMPRVAGMAIGLDRLVMALTDATDISQVQVR